MVPRFAWPLAIGLVTVAGIGAVIATRSEPRQAASAPATAAAPDDAYMAARTKGSATAPITVLEIVDFQCPACRVFWAETMPLLQQEYVRPGKVRFLFVNLPLVQIHPNAAASHEFAMCAAAQDKFWPVHDMLFESQGVWARLDDPSPYFYTVANATGVDTDSLDACIADGRMRGLIMQEANSLVQAGVRSTPSFVIEGGLLEGAVPIEGWRPILDSIYEAKTR